MKMHHENAYKVFFFDSEYTVQSLDFSTSKFEFFKR